MFNYASIIYWTVCIGTFSFWLCFNLDCILKSSYVIGNTWLYINELRYGCSRLNITLVSILLNILSNIYYSSSFFFNIFYLYISSISNLFFILNTSFRIVEFIFSSSSSFKLISSNNNFLRSVSLHFFKILSFFKYSLIL